MVDMRWEACTQYGSWLFSPMANIELPKPMPKAIIGKISNCCEAGITNNRDSRMTRNKSKQTSGQRPANRLKNGVPIRLAMIPPATRQARKILTCMTLSLSR
ncbi:hypothetical protein XBP1_2170095 [Xenorhabdus bovienii str. puntauvense]|uniref:Uncharacterized protein n=1 Tax=Xenorhabdus bovienii str. puntauvense TaxID=1398201 RepID=A0A077NFM8_XENBV|nr:hypothetical protein XBP1_2170095 [Xenorhabdus bovienii str. puntauvense]